MQMGMVGLGRMGASMVRRLMRGGHECVVYDVNADAVARVVKEGVRGTSSLDAFAAALKTPSGNSHYIDDIRRAKVLATHGIHYVDAGTSGGAFWRRGSVIASWLLDLTANALAADPDLKTFAGRVSDSGEGRWTITAAIDEGVPAPVLSAALYERFSSRGQADFADQLLSAMRYQFGDHLEKSRTAGSAGTRDAS